MKDNRRSFQHRQCVLCHVALTTLGKILWMLHTTSSRGWKVHQIKLEGRKTFPIRVTHSNSSYHPYALYMYMQNIMGQAWASGECHKNWKYYVAFFCGLVFLWHAGFHLPIFHTYRYSSAVMWLLFHRHVINIVCTYQFGQV